MVCRSRERGERARALLEQTPPAVPSAEAPRSSGGPGNSSNEVLQVLGGFDVGAPADVRRLWRALQRDPAFTRLDGVVCNAGALLREPKFTPPGHLSPMELTQAKLHFAELHGLAPEAVTDRLLESAGGARRRLPPPAAVGRPPPPAA